MNAGNSVERISQLCMFSDALSDCELSMSTFYKAGAFLKPIRFASLELEMLLLRYHGFNRTKSATKDESNNISLNKLSNLL